MNCENSRLLFPRLALVKKEVTERFLVVTQSIYKQHPVYTYRDKEEETKVLIYPAYANPKHDGKLLRFIVKVNSYNFHLNDTLNRNMAEEIVKNGLMAGYKTKQMIQASLTILVQAYTEEESSDAADELMLLINYACAKQYSSYGLIVKQSQVSETDIVNDAQKIYQTTISCGFDIPWSFENTTTEGVIVGVHYDIDWERNQMTNKPYEQPKVTVHQERKSEQMKTFKGLASIRDE